MMSNLDPLNRFSSRVADYVKYRPDYPRRIVDILHERIGLLPEWKVADVGCGTGISSRMFLENGNEVFAVEPNDDMRHAAEQEFCNEPRFHPVKGTSAATTLPDGSVDLAIVAQAFHWFDRPATNREFRRILSRTGRGAVAIMWNQRLTTGNFGTEYDLLLQRYCPEYMQVSQRWVISPGDLQLAFGVPFERFAISNTQLVDLSGLNGRAASSSYVPQAGQPNYDAFYDGLKTLFEQYQQEGLIEIKYETELFLGKLFL